MRLLFLAAAALLALPLPSSAQRVSADGTPQTFHALTEQYFADYFRLNPTSGTTAGFHQYDTQLEDYSAAGVAAQVAFLHGYDRKLSALDPKALNAPEAADLQVLLNNIHSQLLSDEVIRNWEKMPDNYSSGITGSVFSMPMTLS